MTAHPHIRCRQAVESMWDSEQPYFVMFLCLSACANSQEQMSSNSHLWINPVVPLLLLFLTIRWNQKWFYTNLRYQNRIKVGEFGMISAKIVGDAERWENQFNHFEICI